MPDEDELRRMLGAADGPRNTVDAARVINRSRARRLPRQLAAGATSALVLAGVTVLAVQTTQYSAPSTTTVGEAYDSGAASPETMDTMLKRAPADKINLCTGTLTEVAPSRYGLSLEVVPPVAATADSGPVPVTVRLTNTSAAEVMGLTPSSPAITFSQGGIVLWHSNGPTGLSLMAVDLAPGESLEYAASFEPVRCEVEDDAAEAFRADLPAVAAGEYALSALIDFTPDASMAQETTELDLVSGPVSPVTLG